MARIWAEYWFNYYGARSIKMEDESGTWYLQIDGDRYKDLLISAKVDVGPSSLWSELQTVSTLDALFDRGIISVVQYLERMPKGYIPELTKLLEELKKAPQVPTEAIPEGAIPPEGANSQGMIPPEGMEMPQEGEEMMEEGEILT